MPPAVPAVRSFDRRRSLAAAALCVLGAGVALMIPFVPYPGLHAVAGLMFLGLAVPAWMKIQRGTFDAFESINLVGFLNFVYFGLGGLWAVTDPFVTGFDTYLVRFIPKTQFYCLLGFGALLAGYYAIPAGPWRPRRWQSVPRGALFLSLPAVLGFIGFVFGAIRARAFWGAHVDAPALFASVAQLKPVFLYAWALSWLLLLSGRATPNQKRVIYFAIVPMAVLVVLSDLAAKIIIMTIVGLPVIAYWYTRRKLPWRTLLVLLVLLVFVIFPFYNNYRVFSPDLPAAERVALTVEHIGQWNASEYKEQTISTFKKRLALITSTAAVVRDVPSRVPYAEGDTFIAPFFAYWVPRILWPDKPEFVFGREFGQLFRIVHILDERTSIAATLPGELFWNYDLPGILIGMAVWGMLIRLFYGRYGAGRPLDPVRRAIYFVLLFEFSMFGAGIAAQLASMMRTVLLLEIFLWFSRRFGLLDTAPMEPEQARN